MSQSHCYSTFLKMCFFSSCSFIIFSVWFFSFLIVSIKNNVFAYNLDVNSAKIFSFPATLNHKRGSYFGYSVAIYANGNDSTLLVGAPRANTSTIQNILEPGAVYQCPINNKCKEWIINTSSNENKHRSATNHAWVGATLSIENNTDPRIVICAPRWKKVTNMYLDGTCYEIAINNANISKNTIEKTIYRPYNGGEIGFSLHLNFYKKGLVVLLGAPDANYRRGLLMIITRFDYEEITHTFPLPYSTVRYDNYLGYAVTSGYYFNKEELRIASSAPRSNKLYGSVRIYSIPDKYNTNFNEVIVTGEQFGEYFGAALASCDINGDDKDELIVGAPQWSQDVDEGRIYVFTTLHNVNFEKQLFHGQVAKGKFGSAITCLGDIDYDGYGDFVVSAPYEEDIGAIYIFNGQSSGLPKMYSQRIIGSQFGENIRGFGISIADPRDINGDKYPDIAVGAYLSEKTVLIKSKPIVKVTTKLIYNDTMMLIRNLTSFFVYICTSYDGINVPDNLRIVSLLKIDQMYGRAIYSTEESSYNTYKFHDTLDAAKMLCKPVKIDLKSNIQNVIDLLEISVSVMLEDDILPKQKETHLNIPCTSCVLINKLNSKTEDLVKLRFTVDCGEDNICTSDVKLTVSTNLKLDRYIIGSASIVKVIINISNYGELAYQAKVHVYIPEILSLASVLSSCIENSYMNNTLEVVCDVGNPLKTNETLELELDMSKVWFDISNVTIWANFTTQSEEKVSLSNMSALTIYFDVDVDIAIAGKAQEDLYSYVLDDDDKKLSSLQFKHIYQVQQLGISPIGRAILIISIPTYWKQSAHDLWIININHTIGHMNGQQIYCRHLNSTPSISLINNSKLDSIYSNLDTQKNLTTNLPPDDRTVYINCTSVNIICTYIECELGPFTSSSSVAKLSVTLDLNLLNLKSNLMIEKDIIYFISNGSIYISQLHNSTQTPSHNPDNTAVATMFVGSPIAKQVATWIKVVSIILGILLLTLLVLGLIKVGFFNRKKKEELQALKSETSKNEGLTLETSS